MGLLDGEGAEVELANVLAEEADDARLREDTNQLTIRIDNRKTMEAKGKVS